MALWDIDRYNELQERAWELDAAAWAGRHTEDDTARRACEANRNEARELRDDAAQLLTRYWAVPSPVRARGRRRSE
jgi:hypothetical protein